MKKKEVITKRLLNDLLKSVNASVRDLEKQTGSRIIAMTNDKGKLFFTAFIEAHKD